MDTDGMMGSPSNEYESIVYEAWTQERSDTMTFSTKQNIGLFLLVVGIAAAPFALPALFPSIEWGKIPRLVFWLVYLVVGWVVLAVGLIVITYLSILDDVRQQGREGALNWWTWYNAHKGDDRSTMTRDEQFWHAAFNILAEDWPDLHQRSVRVAMLKFAYTKDLKKILDQHSRRQEE
jgi:hypothetical protein